MGNTLELHLASRHVLHQNINSEFAALPSCRVNSKTPPDSMNQPKEEITFYEEHPSMFRNRPVEFGVNILLCLVVVGFFLFFAWWFKCKGTTLTVTNHRTRLRKGILSKSITEVWHQDVRNVQLNQSFFQRILGVGTIGISSAGQSEIEIKVAGIPDPERVKELIDKYRPR